jgi:Tfp pilus assembly protein PilV
MKRTPKPDKLVRRPGSAGMTLFEVMIAAGVTLVAVVVAMGSIISIATTSTVSETQVMATNIVSSVLERVRTMPLDELVALTPPTDLA